MRSTAMIAHILEQEIVDSLHAIVLKFDDRDEALKTIRHKNQCLWSHHVLVKGGCHGPYY